MIKFLDFDESKFPDEYEKQVRKIMYEQLPFGRENFDKGVWHLWKPAHRFIALEGNKIVGHLGVSRHMIISNNTKIIVGGIDDVVTKEEFKHKGIATQLMVLAIEFMIKNKYEISILFSDRPIMIRISNKFGFKKIDTLSRKVGGKICPIKIAHILALKGHKNEFDLLMEKGACLEESWQTLI